MAIINKKAEPLAAAAPEKAPEKAAETSVKAPEKSPVKAAEKAVGKVVEKVAEKKAAKAKAPAKEKKAPAAKKTTVKKSAAAKLTLCVEHHGKQVTEEAIVAAVKADWKGEAIKTLDIYVKPEDGAVYYVVNGSGTGKVDF